MRHAIIVLLLLICSVSFGQTSSLNLSENFIEKAIQYYYNPQAIKQKNKPTFLILKDIGLVSLKTNYAEFDIVFVTRDEAIQKISRTNKKIGQLDKIETKWLSKDTFDISIGGWSVSVKKVNETVNGQKIKYRAQFGAGCGGTLGYIPTCRFIFDESSKTWAQLTDGEIMKQQLAKQNALDN